MPGGNEQVKLSGFGNFDLRDKSQRPGRNPKTGEEIPISARRVVTFRPGQKLKARVETYGEEQAAARLQDNNETRNDDSESSQFDMRAFEGGNEQ